MDYMATIEGIAKAHGIEVKIRHGMPLLDAWESGPDSPPVNPSHHAMINLSDEPMDELGFAAGLHELGHAINPKANFLKLDKDRADLVAYLSDAFGFATSWMQATEAEATKWALTQFTPSAKAATLLLSCLTGYTHPKLPVPAYFKGLVKQAGMPERCFKLLDEAFTTPQVYKDVTAELVKLGGTKPTASDMKKMEDEAGDMSRMNGDDLKFCRMVHGLDNGDGPSVEDVEDYLGGCGMDDDADGDDE